MIAALAVAVAVGLAVAAWLCFRLSRLHEDLADAYTLVASMLRARDLKAAEALAEQHRQTKLSQGRWKS